MTETLPNGYSSESTQRELSNEYQHDRVPYAVDESSLSNERVNDSSSEGLAGIQYFKPSSWAITCSLCGGTGKKVAAPKKSGTNLSVGWQENN